MQLPIYFVVSLGCYGLLMVGVGLMNFPTCPQEALLLQKVFLLLCLSDCIVIYLIKCCGIYSSYGTCMFVVCTEFNLLQLFEIISGLEC